MKYKSQNHRDQAARLIMMQQQVNGNSEQNSRDIDSMQASFDAENVESDVYSMIKMLELPILRKYWIRTKIKTARRVSMLFTLLFHFLT